MELPLSWSRPQAAWLDNPNVIRRKYFSMEANMSSYSLHSCSRDVATSNVFTIAAGKLTRGDGLGLGYKSVSKVVAS